LLIEHLHLIRILGISRFIAGARWVVAGGSYGVATFCAHFDVVNEEAKYHLRPSPSV
jgi:hypothetical protein